MQKGYSLDRFIKGFPSVDRRQAEAFLELGLDLIEDLVEEEQEKEPARADTA